MPSPQATLTTIAMGSSRSKTGITKVRAKMNFDKKVESVDAHICFLVWAFSASSDMWIPSASEKASAIAIVRNPPSTAGLEWVPECKPTMSPRVVITPEVMPKLMPVFKDSFT